MKAMILAAGRGTRMKPLSDSIPKPLLKVGSRSLIEHLIVKLGENGFQEIVINVAHLGSKIINSLGSGKQFGVTLHYSEENPDGGLETGGGIFQALPLLGQDPFLVVSGDIWTDYDFARLRQKALPGWAHLVLVDNPLDHIAGDFNLKGEHLCMEEGGKRLTFGNIGIYHPDLFQDCQPGFFRLGTLLVNAIKIGKVTGEYYQGRWVNVSTPEVLAQLNAEQVRQR